ncbi:hypothetical protein BIU97_01795 [Curtobacterium sp. MCBA15_009]|nr:hypothetical protein BIU97_01795 [Curtobacterium sp. MCBA15_009]
MFRVAYEQVGSITSRELFAILRARGFREAKRKGVNGFVGIRVPESVATLPALVPEHSASSYRRGDRSPEAKRARQTQALDKKWSAELRDAPDRFAVEAKAEYLRERAEAPIRSEIARLKREARDLERIVSTLYGGTEAPPLDRDARKLRETRDRISDLYADLQRMR